MIWITGTVVIGVILSAIVWYDDATRDARHVGVPWYWRLRIALSRMLR